MKTTKMKTTKIIVLSLIISVLTSCTTEGVQTEEINEKVSEEILSKLSSIGFDTESIPAMVVGDNVFVEGDIKISIEQLLKKKNTRQAFSALLSCKNAKVIKIKNNLGNTVQSQALKIAVRRWNNASRENSLKFKLVNRGEDLKAEFVDQRTGVAASVNVPFFGSIEKNSLIEVDPDIRTFNNKKINTKQWSQILTHELGHIIGLRHAKNPGNSILEFNQITGTLNLDRASIMFNGVQRIGAPGSIEARTKLGLSRNDKIALRRMYNPRSSALCNDANNLDGGFGS